MGHVFQEYNIETCISQIKYWDMYFTEHNIGTCISQNKILGHLFHRI